VAEDAGGGMRSGGDLLEVGAADAAGVDAQEQFSGADGGHGNGFEADVIDSPVNGSQHGGWNRLAPVFHRDLSGNPHSAFDELQLDEHKLDAFQSRFGPGVSIQAPAPSLGDCRAASGRCC
jgi:hypothetical protein